MRLEMGYPRLGGRQQHLRFTEGENISELVTLRHSGDSFANSVVAYGAGEGSKQLRSTATQRDGRLRRATAVDAPHVTSQAALTSVAEAELGRVRQLTDITSFTVRDHPHAPVGSFAPGDDVLVQTTAGWQPARLWVRVTSCEHSVDSGEITVTCARSDGFRYDGGGR